jgi:hypothetical protein
MKVWGLREEESAGGQMISKMSRQSCETGGFGPLTAIPASPLRKRNGGRPNGVSSYDGDLTSGQKPASIAVAASQLHKVIFPRWLPNRIHRQTRDAHSISTVARKLRRHTVVDEKLDDLSSPSR